MNTYTAHFRTDAEYAVYDFDAATPDQALKEARALYERDPDALAFEPYDGGMPLDEIEISSPEGDALAVWHSDDMRLRLAARDMLTALQMAANFIGDDLSDDLTEKRIYETIMAAITKAAGN
jgi:hypothetical protein